MKQRQLEQFKKEVIRLGKQMQEEFRQKHGRYMTEAEMTEEVDFQRWMVERNRETLTKAAQMSDEAFDAFVAEQKQAYLQAHNLHKDYRLPMDKDY